MSEFLHNLWFAVRLLGALVWALGLTASIGATILSMSGGTWRWFFIALPLALCMGAATPIVMRALGLVQ